MAAALSRGAFSRYHCWRLCAEEESTSVVFTHRKHGYSGISPGETNDRGCAISISTRCWLPLFHWVPAAWGTGCTWWPLWFMHVYAGPWPWGTLQNFPVKVSREPFYHSCLLSFLLPFVHFMQINSHVTAESTQAPSVPVCSSHLNVLILVGIAHIAFRPILFVLQLCLCIWEETMVQISHSMLKTYYRRLHSSWVNEINEISWVDGMSSTTCDH